MRFIRFRTISSIACQQRSVGGGRFECAVCMRSRTYREQGAQDRKNSKVSIPDLGDMKSTTVAHNSIAQCAVIFMVGQNDEVQ